MAKSGSQLQMEIDDYLGRGGTSPVPRVEAGIIADVLAHAPASGKSAAQLDREIAQAAYEAQKVATAEKVAELKAEGERAAKAAQARIDAYQAKQERKREGLTAASRKAAGRAAAAFGTAHRIGEGIPMGQPILVGHHSEKRHRRDVAKIDSSMRKGIAEDKYAKELAARAASIGTAGISSDDPEAVKKLKIELNKLQLDQDRMKAGNAAIRKHAKAGVDAQVAALTALGFSEKLSRSALEKDFAGRIGFPDYAIKNNGANLRRIEKRIAELVEKETTPARESIKGGDDALSWEIRENKDLNRTQIVFSGQPPKEIRERLKSAGFKWAPTEGAWQRHLSNGAWYHAKQALGVK